MKKRAELTFAWSLCSRSGEARRPLRHVSESGHQDRQQGEAQRVRSDEGETLVFNVLVPPKINRRFEWTFYPESLLLRISFSLEAKVTLSSGCFSHFKHVSS